MTGLLGGRPWAIILAGGEGSRLRPLTRLIAGDDRPKQFCRVVGDATLLDQTRRRTAALVDPARTVLVLTRTHQPFYAPLVRDLPARSVVVQPSGRGTAPAVLYGALRVAREAPTAAVVVMPSDHHVSDDARLMEHARRAVLAVSRRPELVVLLGIEASHPEREYGWIEVGDAVPGTEIRRVRRFWEKPSAAVAYELWRRGCLWNSFVIVATAPALFALFRRWMPALTSAFAPLARPLAPRDEARAADDVYAALDAASFSDVVLAAAPANLAVLPVTGVDWTDCGTPGRVREALARLGTTPARAVRDEARSA